MLKQRHITQFFQKDHIESEIISSRVKFEPLFYDRERAEIILDNLPKIKKECMESYKSKKIKVKPEKVDRVFEILKSEEALKLMALFERDIPLSRKYYKRLANEFQLIVEKNFCEVFIQVKEILSMTEEFPHIIRGSAGCSLVCGSN